MFWLSRAWSAAPVPVADEREEHTSVPQDSSPVSGLVGYGCVTEHEEVRCFSCQLRNQLTGTFLGRQSKLNDPDSINLFDLVDSCALQMRTEKLTEGWRCRWILKSCCGEVKTGGFRLA